MTGLNNKMLDTLQATIETLVTDMSSKKTPNEIDAHRIAFSRPTSTFLFPLYLLIPTWPGKSCQLMNSKKLAQNIHQDHEEPLPRFRAGTTMTQHW